MLSFQEKGSEMQTFMLLLLLAICSHANAQVYKCKDANGKVNYGNMPCAAAESSSAVNLSGAGQSDSSANSNSNAALLPSKSNAACPELASIADQTYRAFTENTSPNRWNVSFKALQNYVQICQSKATCELVSFRTQSAQLRFSENRSSARGEQLSGISLLKTQACSAGEVQIKNEAGSDVTQRNYWTKDQFGTPTRSDKCFWTKDAFGTAVRSAGCK